jgi:hypothetical protein
MTWRRIDESREEFLNAQRALKNNMSAFDDLAD